MKKDIDNYVFPGEIDKDSGKIAFEAFKIHDDRMGLWFCYLDYFAGNLPINRLLYLASYWANLMERGLNCGMKLKDIVEEAGKKSLPTNLSNGQLMFILEVLIKVWEHGQELYEISKLKNGGKIFIRKHFDAEYFFFIKPFWLEKDHKKNNLPIFE